jgi:hypothetical protein
MSQLTTILISSTSGFVGGVAAWFCGNYLGRPIIQFWNLRSETRRSLYYYANINPYPPLNPRDVAEAQESIRWLAARFDAMRTSSPTLILKAFAWQGYDLAGAALGLTGLSNTLGTESDAVLFLVQAERALKLPSNPEDELYFDDMELIKGRSLWTGD